MINIQFALLQLQDAETILATDVYYADGHKVQTISSKPQLTQTLQTCKHSLANYL